MDFKQLSAKARTLKRQLRTIEKSPAQQYRGQWVDIANPNGNKYYYRLRRWENGKKGLVRNLERKEVESVQALIDQAREADRIESELNRVCKKLDRLIARAAKMGVYLKNPLGDRDATTEWYTPPSFITLVREVLGTIDLDPASCATAQDWIQAKVFYTQEQDGLSQPWFGRIYCNPPYGSEEVRLMARRFLLHGIEKYQASTIDSAIFLLNRTGAEWYRHALQNVCAICEVHKRIPFIDAEGKPQRGSRNYNDFLYLGAEKELFAHLFGAVGTIRML